MTQAKPANVPTPEPSEVVRTHRIELLTDDGTVAAVLAVEDQRDIADDDVAPFVLTATTPDSGGVVWLAQLFR